jgi:streptomycin 3"-adenylyltransferase
MAQWSVQLNTFLSDLGNALQTTVGRNLVALYVYGSLTQDAFDPRRSDVDCVALIRHGLRSNVVARLRRELRRQDGPWLRRLQLTILVSGELLRVNGRGWLYQFGRLRRSGSDGNPIIWVNILHSGRVIVGPAPKTVVPPITVRVLRAALLRELGYLRDELITKRSSMWRARLSYRRYAALTMCRILYTFATGQVASKRVAATWAQSRVPVQHRAIVRRARDTSTRGRLPLRDLRKLLLHIEQRLGGVAVKLTGAPVL